MFLCLLRCFLLKNVLCVLFLRFWYSKIIKWCPLPLTAVQGFHVRIWSWSSCSVFQSRTSSCLHCYNLSQAVLVGTIGVVCFRGDSLLPVLYQTKSITRTTQTSANMSGLFPLNICKLFLIVTTIIVLPASE